MSDHNSVSARNVENSRQKRALASTNTCDSVKTFFQSRNIPLRPSNSPKGNICGGQCCGKDSEAKLRQHGQHVFSTMLSHNFVSLQGLLNSAATTLQSHVAELTQQSKMYTSKLISQVYKKMPLDDTINGFYLDIQNYIHINTSQETPSTDIDINNSVENFFVELFPLAYQNVVGLQNKEFSAEYKKCMKETFNDVQPFGEIPKQLSLSLSKSFDATRLLMQALGIGVEVLNVTHTLIIEDNGKSNIECHDAIMKMTFCHKCMGLKVDSKPCSGYCLNVLRGCLTKYVSELDMPWTVYIDSVEKLVTAIKQKNNEAGVSIDTVIRGLYTRISESIMHIMEIGNDLQTKVKKMCGSVTYNINTTAVVETTENNLSVRQSNIQYATFPESQMSHFLNTISKKRSFYAQLADNFCSDESFAVTKDQHCWNGDRIGEYTKTVADATLDMQKYNPEIKTNIKNVDSRVASLSDKLRHIQQMVMSSLGTVSFPESDYMQSDRADGSGSGGGPDMSEDDDDDLARGSGSGHESYDPKEPGITEIGKDVDIKSDKPASGSSMQKSSYILQIMFVLLSIVFRLL